MAEHHDRCRFWPHCAIHVGQDRPRQFSAANRAEMASMRAAGLHMSEIGDAFGISRSSVTEVLRRWRAHTAQSET